MGRNKNLPRKRSRNSTGGNSSGSPNNCEKTPSDETSPQHKAQKRDQTSYGKNHPTVHEKMSTSQVGKDGEDKTEMDPQTFQTTVLTLLGKLQTDIVGVKTQVESIDTRIEAMDVKLGRHNESIERMAGDIEQIKDCNEKQSGRLDKLEEELARAKQDLVQMQRVKENAPRHMLVLKYQLDMQEQHTRKEAVRISGLPEGPDEETDTILRAKIVKMATDAGMKMTNADISVCHRLGSKQTTRVRNVICKFVARSTKHKLMGAKKNLKDKPEYKQVFINEDLTRLRSRMLNMVRRNERTKSCYTRDGKIICIYKDGLRERSVIIETPDQLFQLGYNEIDLRDLGLGDFTEPYLNRANDNV